MSPDIDRCSCIMSDPLQELLIIITAKRNSTVSSIRNPSPSANIRRFQKANGTIFRASWNLFWNREHMWEDPSLLPLLPILSDAQFQLQGQTLGPQEYSWLWSSPTSHVHLFTQQLFNVFSIWSLSGMCVHWCPGDIKPPKVRSYTGVTGRSQQVKTVCL